MYHLNLDPVILQPWEGVRKGKVRRSVGNVIG